MKPNIKILFDIFIIMYYSASSLLNSNIMTFVYPSFPGVLVLTQIINPFRTIPFNLKDQFGLAYGGLRGAISFALVFTLPDNIGRKKLFVTATIAIILFTVFLQVRAASVCSVLVEYDRKS